MGPCSRDREKWTGSSGQAPLTEPLQGARDDVPSHHRCQQRREETAACTGSGLAQGPAADLGFPTQARLTLKPRTFLSTPLHLTLEGRSFQGSSLPLLPKHTASRDLLGDSLRCLVGAIYLGVDKHPPTGFPCNTCSTHRCQENDSKQASPSAFKLSMHTPKLSGPRQSRVQILPLAHARSVTLGRSLRGVSFDRLIRVMGVGIPASQGS